jgi:AraC family transcriptional regulator of adaptative response / DNA-3-methyladenine glycosylase II
MRALGDPDVFMSTDLGVRHALERLGHDGSPAAATALAERWSPWRSYALHHLWQSLSAPTPTPTPTPTSSRRPGRPGPSGRIRS